MALSYYQEGIHNNVFKLLNMGSGYHRIEVNL